MNERTGSLSMFSWCKSPHIPDANIPDRHRRPLSPPPPVHHRPLQVPFQPEPEAKIPSFAQSPPTTRASPSAVLWAVAASRALEQLSSRDRPWPCVAWRPHLLQGHGSRRPVFVGVREISWFWHPKLNFQFLQLIAEDLAMLPSRSSFYKALFILESIPGDRHLRCLSLPVSQGTHRGLCLECKNS